MPDQTIINKLQSAAALMEQAAVGKTEATAALASAISEANASHAEIPQDIRKIYQDGLNKVSEHIDPKSLSDPAIKLLRAALNARLDAPILRDRYVALAKHDFPNYHDRAGLGEFLGIRDTNVTIDMIIKRWSMLEQIKSGAYCFDKDFNMGRVIALDDMSNEVQAHFDRRRSIPLDAFFKDFVIIRDLSSLHTLLSGGQLPVRRTGQNLRAELEDCIICGDSLPENCLRQILVPNVMTAPYFKAQVLGIVEEEEPPHPQKNTRPTISKHHQQDNTDQRWDESRTVLELSERLKNDTSLEVPDGNVNKANIERIFKQAAPRTDLVDKVALSLAFLQKMAGPLQDWITETARSLAPTAAVWLDIDLCAEASDKIPGKMALSWFEVTRNAMGGDFLAHLTIKLPYRLWGHAEKVLGKEKDLLADAVLDSLSKNHATADMLYWLWRSNLQDAKNKYLSDSAMLFRTLQQETRGNYLKAQRDMRKLLLDDIDFLKQHTLYGDHDAVLELIRCIKRLPLLDTGEMQSLLVKIADLYPQYISDVEQKRQGPAKMNIGKLTSIRGYNKRQAELEDLLKVQMPENVQAIEHARGLGDLRENSEFKFAKERQAFLGRRRREWEESLNGMRTTDFANVNVTNVVIPGCTVTVKYRDGHQESFHILGMLDGEPDKHIISYDAPLGKTLVGMEIGARISMPDGQKATIESVKPLSPELLKYVAG